MTACSSEDSAADSSVSPTAHAAASEDGKGDLALPVPTGEYAVGRNSLHLVDRSRRDPWAPRAGDRELMVSMYYPAQKGTGKLAQYMSSHGAQAFLNEMKLESFAKALGGTRTHTYTDAKPESGRFALVVFSPGFKMPGATLTSLAEDLTSRGYVVAVVDHAYEAGGVDFPGKGILPCMACGKVGPTSFRPAAEGRAADLSFTLDQLIGNTSPWMHADMIEKDSIGMAGHSLGGASTAATMAHDPRVHAGVNLDGPFIDSGSESGLSGRPLLMLGTKADHSPGSEDKTWAAAWQKLEGWKRWATVTGADHFTFTDLAPLADQLGEDEPNALPGKRAVEITRDYVGSFFDEHLRGNDQPLLDGPSKAHPEVTFEHASAY
ncbi:alpha/beta hydrolase family protein [Streptomyces sp. NPDC005931]|uniref:alpha/beta hydrolase family protein n=1 Tax=Streptomyces sp. NPDC005931 TaxID=3364737 RepID=UPI003696AA0F